MPLPPDQKIAKARILYNRARLAHDAYEVEAERRLYALRLVYEKHWNELCVRARELGYCPHCELPLAECKGHVMLAGPPKCYDCEVCCDTGWVSGGDIGRDKGTSYPCKACGKVLA